MALPFSRRSPAAIILATGGRLASSGKPREGCEGYRRSSQRYPGRSGRRRAVFLGLVHLIIAGHLLHWIITGNTLSPVEPSESMYTLENGQVNAGFIFFIVAILSTAILGRWFCGWACHMVALQDLCGWMMRKVGVRPRPFRSRLLGFVPYILAFYMFLWPALKRWASPWLDPHFASLASWLGPVTPWPGFSDHLMVTDFWATFPPLLVAIPFFLICGFACVYLLGAKGFCSYGCPYGAFFSVADRIAPMRILANMDACNTCGLCTANCTSNVQISREIRIHSQVVDPGCMKCLDCVDVCPNGVLSYGPGMRNPISASSSRSASSSKSDLSLAGEVVLAVIFSVAWICWRGVAQQIPMLMATGIALAITFLLWKSYQILTQPDVSLHRQPLRRGGTSTTRAKLLMASAILCTLLTVSAGHTRWNQHQADGHFSLAEVNLDRVLLPQQEPVSAEVKASARRAIWHLQQTIRFGRGGLALFEPAGTILEQRLGYMSAVSGDLEAARSWWTRALEENPTDDLLVRFGQLIEITGEGAAGPKALADWLDEQRNRLGNRIVLLNLRGELARRQALAAVGQGNPEAAARHLQALIDWVGDEPQLLLDIAKLLEEAGIGAEARSFRERAQLQRQ